MDQFNVKEEKDEDEIDLDDDDDEEEADKQDDNKQDERPVAAAAPDVAEEVKEEPAVNDSKQDLDDNMPSPEQQPAVVTMSKSAAMKQRLRQLKQKMNQARHLNQQAVKQEGERMGSHEAQVKEKRRLRAMDKQSAAQHLASTNQKALQMAAQHDVEPKYLLQQASESVKKTNARLESQERNQYSVNDTYNPEGQHRNYQNSLKQLPRGGGKQSSQRSIDRLQETFDPLQHQLAVAAASGSAGSAGVAGVDDRPFLNAQQERQGARRLAQEMHQRMERNKKKEGEKKRKQELQEEQQHEDVGYINSRNKRFNQKINRTYGKDTAEIKQNLERGTAL